jgi:hypothetical protein
MPAELHWPAVNENFRGAAADSQMLNLTLAGASEHEAHEARLQRSVSHDFTPIRVRMPGCSITIVSGQNGANDGQHHLRVPVTDQG